jgi:hypothetical protein
MHLEYSMKKSDNVISIYVFRAHKHPAVGSSLYPLVALAGTFDITRDFRLPQCRLVISYRLFGTACRSHFQGSRSHVSLTTHAVTLRTRQVDVVYSNIPTA